MTQSRWKLWYLLWYYRLRVIWFSRHRFSNLLEFSILLWNRLLSFLFSCSFNSENQLAHLNLFTSVSSYFVGRYLLSWLSVFMFCGIFHGYSKSQSHTVTFLLKLKKTIFDKNFLVFARIFYFTLLLLEHECLFNCSNVVIDGRFLITNPQKYHHISKEIVQFKHES